MKPRFFGTRATFDADTLDGFFVERDEGGQPTMRARMDRARLSLAIDRARGRATFADGTITCEIELGTHAIVVATCATEASHPPEGHRLSLSRYHAMRLLLDGVLSGVNPVSARWLEPSEAPRRLAVAPTPPPGE